MMFALPAILSQASSSLPFLLSPLFCPILLIESGWTISSTNVSYFLANQAYNVSLVSGTQLNNLNGITGYTFDGVNDYAGFPNARHFNWANRCQQYTVALLFFANSGSTNKQQIIGTSPSSQVTVGVQIEIDNSTNLINCTIKSVLTGTAYPVSISAPFTKGEWQLLIWSGYNVHSIGQDSCSFIRMNGGNNIFNPDPGTSVRPFQWSSTGHSLILRLGGSTTGEYFSGRIAEFIYIPYTLTMEAIYRLEAHITGVRNLKSILPSNHPYKNITPSRFSDATKYYNVNNPLDLN
jgi:hypothetical protein